MNARNHHTQALLIGMLAENVMLPVLELTAMKLPEQWAEELGWDVMDWDGWNDVIGPVGPNGEMGGRYLGNECSRQEFMERVVVCTCRRFSIPL